MLNGLSLGAVDKGNGRPTHHIDRSAPDSRQEYSVEESVREAILWLLPKLDRLRVPAASDRTAKHVEPDCVDMKVAVGSAPVDARVISEGYELHLYIT